MKFTVTNLSEVASSLTADNFSDVSAGCASVLVDIRNPSATVANLKAAAAVKLKLRDAQNVRMVAVFVPAAVGSTGSARLLDDLEAERKAVLTSVFTAGADAEAIQLYTLRSSETQSTVLDAIAAGGKVASAGGALSSPAATSAEHTTGGAKRSRDEGADDGDRTVLSPEKVASPTTAPAEPAPATVSAPSTAAATTTATTNVNGSGAGGSRLQAARTRQSQREGTITSPGEGDDDEWEDAEDDDDDADADGDSAEFEEWADPEEGDEWGSDDDDGIEWANVAMDMGLVPELAPAERDLITALIELPNAGQLIQQVMDGHTAEAMAEVQTSSPRLFELISEHGALFTELMEDIKEMLDHGIINSGAGVIEHLRKMVTESDEADELMDVDEEEEEGGENAEGANGGDEAARAARTAERRRARRQQNEAAMTDTLNALAGGASDMRPLTDVDEARITSLVELGFERDKAVAAYLRMGRNVERAANNLFENM